MQAKITSSENQIKELADAKEALERQNENLAQRARELEMAAQIAVQTAANAGVSSCALILKAEDASRRLRNFTFGRSKIALESLVDLHD